MSNENKIRLHFHYLLHILLVITKVKIDVSVKTPKLKGSSIVGSGTRNTMEMEMNTTA